MAKQRDCPYEPGRRVRHWRKVKVENQQVKLDAKAKDLQAEAETLGARFDAREAQFQATVEGAQREHTEREAASGDERIGQLEAHVAQLTEVVGQLLQAVVPAPDMGAVQ